MPRQCVLLCLKPIRKRLMRCQLLGQLEHVLGRPFSYVVLPRPDTPWGGCAPSGGSPFLAGAVGDGVTTIRSVCRVLDERRRAKQPCAFPKSSFPIPPHRIARIAKPALP